MEGRQSKALVLTGGAHQETLPSSHFPQNSSTPARCLCTVINKASAAGAGTGWEFDRAAVNMFPPADDGQTPPPPESIGTLANNRWALFFLPYTSANCIRLCGIFLGEAAGRGRDSVYMEHIQIPSDRYWLRIRCVLHFNKSLDPKYKA